MDDGIFLISASHTDPPQICRVLWEMREGRVPVINPLIISRHHGNNDREGNEIIF